MCKFCNEEYEMDRGMLRSKNVNLGALGNGCLAMDMWTEKNETFLHAWIGFENDNTVRISKRINYCPFCGRKLSEASENE